MDHATLARALRAALVKHSRVRNITVADEDRLDGSVGLDSVALLNALLEIEDETGLEVEPSRLADVREMTFAQLVDLLLGASVSSQDARGARGAPTTTEAAP